MKITRRFTKAGHDSYEGIQFGSTNSEIRGTDGALVFGLSCIEMPQSWSQVAVDVLAQKYFRKAGVAAKLRKIKEEGVPEFLWRSEPDEKALEKLPEERSLRWRDIGEAGFLTVWQALGPIGAGRAAISTPKMMRKRFLTSAALYWQSKCLRRIRRSGSIPGCTGRTESTGRGRGILSSTI